MAQKVNEVMLDLTADIVCLSASCRRRGWRGYWGSAAVHGNSPRVQRFVLQLRHRPTPTADRFRLRLIARCRRVNWRK